MLIIIILFFLMFFISLFSTLYQVADVASRWNNLGKIHHTPIAFTALCWTITLALWMYKGP